MSTATNLGYESEDATVLTLRSGRTDVRFEIDGDLLSVVLTSPGARAFLTTDQRLWLADWLRRVGMDD